MNAIQEGLTSNPLLDFSGLPRFANLSATHVRPAVNALLEEARATVEQVATDAAEATWDNVVVPLARAFDRLERSWGHVSHLNAVANSPELRDIYNEMLPAITDLHTDMGQDPRLYRRYSALAVSRSFSSLDAAARRVITNALRDFRLSGAELAEDAKARFKAIQEELASLGARYEDNVLDATNDYGLFIDDESRLAGLPSDVIAAARDAATEDGKAGWKFSLRMPSYLPAMKHAHDRGIRETLYRAFETRASEFGKPEWDNSSVVLRILALRAEEARLLGYSNYAEVSLVPKMAASPQEVFAFLRDLARRARPYAERDMVELRSFAAQDLGISELAAWDILYASEQLREKKYAFSDEELRQYFPEDRVLAGMFRVVESIYSLHICESRTETWHPAVRFFDILSDDGRLVGQFYLDLYARPKKRGGAWMDIAINRRKEAEGIRHPVAYLVCNFPAPVGGKPALFSHDDVSTLFHEFGHGLHLLLTEIDTPGVAGMEGVEWDAVELPSQFMENYCWEWEVLSHMTAHVDTGAPLPRALFEKMIAAKNFHSGMATMRQLEFALFDFHLHFDFDPRGGRTPLDLLAEIRREVAVTPRPDYARSSTHAFGHIFGGGYAAGYYSYKWAEVLSADAYALFEELGVLSQDAGSRFRAEVLARGGSRPALDSFIAFRGRPPQIDALLRHNGMSPS